jgi:polysaccharide export outer membrane protein
MKAMTSPVLTRVALGLALLACATPAASAGQIVPAAPAPQARATGAAADTAVVPADYVIGRDDVLSIVFWRDRDLSAEVVVRPDGRISLPLLNDIDAAGLTPIQLRDRILEKASRYIAEPNATVLVRQINSRKVYITGQVLKPGVYPLTSPTTVLQLIALAGGLADFANGKKIAILRLEGTRQQSYRFNYEDVINLKNLSQNILLKPGDNVIVP